MVSGFRLSFSLLSLNPGTNHCRRRRDAPHHHMRSTSLPCPVLSPLLDEIRSLRSSRDRDGFDRIYGLLAALDDLLHLPRARDTLRRRTASADRLLDDLLRLADAHGSFRSAAIALKQHLCEGRTAIRRRDPVRFASAARSHRRVEKEIAGLASAIKDLARSPPLAPGIGPDSEIAGIIAEALAATAGTSTEVFLSVSGWGSWMVWAMRRPSKKGSEEAEMVAMEKLEEMMERNEGLEAGSGRVYRSLVNTRVTLLNMLTPSS
ncbi:hypothetical protein BHE74_00007261 [Ensete ventricosum]|nr:hypothetical protein GW17_00046083 [Ensete ventricosum]RWW84147.1 hypothetical protein BHE74_00007261 [Ensete ventricosum]RZR77691.1 hypothetical protein BHM03_00002803 [Ensete ventricosum]